MALINVTNVEVLDNPSTFSNPFQFQITFECVSPGIQEELEWKLIYVGSAEDEKYDQELDSVLVGPVSIGNNRFVFQAPAPDPTKIPKKDLLEVTVLLLTCSYKEKEFIRVGYYVNNDYEGFTPPTPFPGGEENMAPVQLPDVLDYGKLSRNILADKPRVTRFQIPWDNNPLLQAQQEGEQMDGAEGVEEEDMEYMADDVGMDDEFDEEEDEEELALDMEQ